jgi:hypothetical protein
MALLTIALTALLASTAPTPQTQDLDEAFRQYSRRLSVALDNSNSPRDWALQARNVWLDADAAEVSRAGGHVDMLRKAAQAAPNDRLVQWLWANAEPARSGCDAAHPCPERAAALARLEPDNAAAWIPVLDEAARVGDVAGVDAALARMAAATRHDDLFVETALAWEALYRRYPLPEDMARHAAGEATPASTRSAAGAAPALAIIAAIARAAAMPLSAQAIRACDRDKNPQAPVARFENCGRIGRLMLGTGNTVIARRFGAAYLRRSRTTAAADLAAERVLEWRLRQSLSLARQFESDPAEMQRYFADLASTGSEVAAQELYLQRAGIALTPPADWQPRTGGTPGG